MQQEQSIETVTVLGKNSVVIPFTEEELKNLRQRQLLDTELEDSSKAKITNYVWGISGKIVEGGDSGPLDPKTKISMWI